MAAARGWGGAAQCLPRDLHTGADVGPRRISFSKRLDRRRRPWIGGGAIAEHLRTRHAHYHFTVKGNQATLHRDLQRYFKDRTAAHFIATNCGHGRIETRSIWTTAAVNG